MIEGGGNLISDYLVFAKKRSQVIGCYAALCFYEILHQSNHLVFKYVLFALHLSTHFTISSFPPW